MSLTLDYLFQSDEKPVRDHCVDDSEDAGCFEAFCSCEEVRKFSAGVEKLNTVPLVTFSNCALADLASQQDSTQYTSLLTFRRIDSFHCDVTFRALPSFQLIKRWHGSSVSLFHEMKVLRWTQRASDARVAPFDFRKSTKEPNMN